MDNFFFVQTSSRKNSIHKWKNFVLKNDITHVDESKTFLKDVDKWVCSFFHDKVYVILMFWEDMILCGKVKDKINKINVGI